MEELSTAHKSQRDDIREFLLPIILSPTNSHERIEDPRPRLAMSELCDNCRKRAEELLVNPPAEEKWTELYTLHFIADDPLNATNERCYLCSKIFAKARANFVGWIPTSLNPHSQSDLLEVRVHIRGEKDPFKLYYTISRFRFTLSINLASVEGKLLSNC
jgi:hypothetical protein